MDAVGVARSISTGRLVFGAIMMVAPSKVMAGWIGRSEARRPAADLMTRSFGAREILLGFIGAHVAGMPGVGKRTIAAMSLLDLTDLLATAAHRDELPRTAMPVMATVAGTAFAAQLWAARELP